MNEAQLVARVRELFSTRIGDDAALVDDRVYTTDLLVEDVDFTRATAPRFIARKSLAVNLSDLAAMGAKPAYALLALAIPEWAEPRLDEMLVAYSEASKEWGVEIIGGDFSRAEKLTIAITAVGTIVTRPLLRSGAKPGDRVYLSRPIGGSAAGLTLLGKEAASYAVREFIDSAIRRQIDPEPELELGVALARIAEVTSCIDISDGLSTDLHHLCDASHVGAEIEKERIPVFPDLMAHARALQINVRDAVLHGGEEYALLFTSSLREFDLSRALGRPVYSIGRITRDREVLLKENGVTRPLEARGWDHFTSTKTSS
ncbi:MAG TPA: thiamine-phosphate kinase [Thermoanaerobaculia bacterium]|nr:thiamine-phosphate kinase [Thermoanaerobaculia bacterium]